MRFESEDRTLVSMETSAFADIIFLLLIFFLLSSSFILPTEIPVNPPSSDSAVTAQDKPIEVTITADGEYFVGEEEVPKTELGTALTAQLADAPVKSVVVRGDKKIDLGTLVEVMDLARNAGAEKLAIATERRARRR